MEDNGWDRIVDAIDERYGLDRHGHDQAPLDDRHDLTQMVAFIEFTRSGVAYRLERISRPAIVDKRSIYHKAASGGIRYENVYDPEAIAHQTKLYRKNGSEWEAIESDELGI